MSEQTFFNNGFKPKLIYNSLRTFTQGRPQSCGGQTQFKQRILGDLMPSSLRHVKCVKCGKERNSSVKLMDGEGRRRFNDSRLTDVYTSYAKPREIRVRYHKAVQTDFKSNSHTPSATTTTISMTSQHKISSRSCGVNVNLNKHREARYNALVSISLIKLLSKSEK